MWHRRIAKSQFLPSQLLESGETAQPSLPLAGWDVQWELKQKQGLLSPYFYIKVLSW